MREPNETTTEETVTNSYFESDSYYYATSTDAFDIRYSNDCHQTYGKQYDDDERSYV